MEINNNKNDKKKEIVTSSSRPLCTWCFYDEQVQVVDYSRGLIFCPMHKAFFVSNYLYNVTLIFNSFFAFFYYILYLFDSVKEYKGTISVLSVIGFVLACFSAVIGLVVFIKKINCCSHRFKPKRIQKH